MLELDWVKLNTRDGNTPPIAYVHGELFGVGGVETVPDNPRGTRSKSIENRCKPRGEWNTYDVVCVDGVIKLAVNEMPGSATGKEQREAAGISASHIAATVRDALKAGAGSRSAV